MLNASRHHSDDDALLADAMRADERCSTPRGITATTTRSAGGEHVARANVLNASRHHSDDDQCLVNGGNGSLEVLNASRHHSDDDTEAPRMRVTIASVLNASRHHSDDDVPHPSGSHVF